MLGPRADAAGTVWSRRRLVAKLDGDAAVSARLGERRSGRMPGWAQMPDRAGAGRVRAWPGRRDRAGARWAPSSLAKKQPATK